MILRIGKHKDYLHLVYLLKHKTIDLLRCDVSAVILDIYLSLSIGNATFSNEKRQQSSHLYTNPPFPAYCSIKDWKILRAYRRLPNLTVNPRRQSSLYVEVNNNTLLAPPHPVPQQCTQRPRDTRDEPKLRTSLPRERFTGNALRSRELAYYPQVGDCAGDRTDGRFEVHARANCGKYLFFSVGVFFIVHIGMTNITFSDKV